ncbi:hypothetical protein [Bradyrhizobium sp. CW10]|uniref:hypothetical protein n=1 Tax=Bradyrhizobium sp. CW10 TaxID=2782683 RepID=UPI001FF80DCF|nr:hypothetical protein [Bradyrhizobium sp. CW10]MCK1472384.1 hypothetical protein [Bradyrhizobium sp. CW10]
MPGSSDQLRAATQANFTDLYTLLGGVNAYNPVVALGNDLLAWWDADAHYWGANGGMTIATGVSSWRDIVAGYSAVQASGAAQPVFSSTSFNGSPGLTSDGIDDCLVCTDAALLTGLPAGDAGGELWSLAQNDNLAGATFFDLFGYANASQSDARTIGGIATPVYGRTVFGTGGGNVSVGGTTLFSGRRVIRGAYSSAGTVLFIDGAQEGSLPGTPATAAARVALFARALATPSNYWTGIGAAFLITKPLSATKAAVLASYLMSRRNP